MTLNKILNDKGMTLVETMAAGALLAGLAVAGMTMFKNQSTGQKTVEANYEITNLFQQIRVVLSDQQNCTQAFAGKNPNGDSSVTSLFKKRVGAAGFDTVYSTNTQISGSNVKITGYRLERLPVTNLATNETWLKITFTKGKSTLMETTTKMMKMIVSPSPAASFTSITSCYAYNNSTDTYWIQGTPPDIYFTAGNVGIGTTAPGAPLQVAGQTSAPAQSFLVTTNSYTAGASGSYIRLGHGASSGNTYGEIDALQAGGTAYGNLVLQAGGGNVGLGLTIPTAQLDIGNGAGQCCATQVPNLSLAQASNTNGRYAWLQFHNSGESEAYIRLAGSGAGARAGQRRLEIGDSQGVNTSLTVTGSIGVGTIDPTASLHVSKLSSGAAITGLALTNPAGGVANTEVIVDLAPNNAGMGIRSAQISALATSNVNQTALIFRTADGGSPTEAMRISSGRNVGIGTTSIPYKLTVQGDVYANGGWLRSSGDSGWYNESYGGGWYMTDTTWIRAYNGKWVYSSGQIRADGSMQVGGGSEITMVPGSGINSLNGYWYPSDRRLKKDITDLDLGLEQILKMRPRNYTWKKSGKKETGFIAQELQSIDPRLVQEMKDQQKTLTLKLEGLFPYVVKALQELHDMIMGNNEEIAKLKKENSELRARLDRQDEILSRIERKATTAK